MRHVPGAGSSAGCIHFANENLLPLPRRHDADFIAYIFDASLPIFATELDDENAHESVGIRNQVASMHELLEALGWTVILVGPGLGANLIATLATNIATQGMRVLVSTENIHLYQFASDKINFLDTPYGRVLDGNEVSSIFGLQTSQLIDYFTLVGTVVIDGAPKIKGISPKVAVKLLNRYGTLDQIIENSYGKKGIANLALAAEADSLLAERDSLRIRNSCDAKAFCSQYPSLNLLRDATPNLDCLERFYTKHLFSNMAAIASLGHIEGEFTSGILRMLEENKPLATVSTVPNFFISEEFLNFAIVYTITNKRTRQRYFGSTGSPELRAAAHIRALTRNTHSNWMLNTDFQLFGFECFEFRVVASFPSLAEARKREQLYINMFWGRSNCYNVSPFAVESDRIGDGSEMKLHLITASLMDNSLVELPLGDRTSARIRGYGRYLSVHAASKDLGFSKRRVLEAIESYGGIIDGWLFEAKTCVWSRQSRRS